MHRLGRTIPAAGWIRALGALGVLACAACADNGSGTGKASLTGGTITGTSAFSKPTKGDDGSGNNVLILDIVIVDDPIGAGCKETSLKIAATIGIYTSQAAGSGAAAIAMLQDGDYSIVPQSPPKVVGAATVDMTASGVGNLNGDLGITGIDLAADGKTVTGFEGTVTAGGTTGPNGTTVTLNGTFSAPICTD
jgi:hypothetical protein